MPLSVLRGRPRRSATTHHYDSNGRIERSVTVEQSPWTERDVDYALAYEAHLDGLCPGGCGQPLSESTARVDKEPVHTYKAAMARCAACDEKATAQDDFADKGKIINPQALLWGVVKTS